MNSTELRVAITGGTGLLGSHLLSLLSQQGVKVRSLVRGSPTQGHEVQGNLEDPRSLERLVGGADVVIHLAGQVPSPEVPPERYRRVNVEGTRSLVDACARAATNPFLVLLSSVSVYGEGTEAGVVLDEESPVAPSGPYPESKLAAEEALWSAGRARGCVLRPTLFFDRGAGRNLATLARVVSRGVVPVVRPASRRSITHVSTVARACWAAARAQVDGATFLVSDPEPLTTVQICEAVAHHRGVSVRSVPLPRLPMQLLARAAPHAPPPLKRLGKAAAVFTRDLAVDTSRAHDLLGLTVEMSALEAIRRGLY